MPMSNIVFPNDEYQFSSLKGMLMNQILTFSNSILIENLVKPLSSKRYLSLQSKLDKIRTLKKYGEHIKGVALDVSSDYQFSVRGYIEKENKINMYKLFAQNFSERIKEHEIFSLEDMDDAMSMDKEMLNMVEMYNNEACKMENGKAHITYSQLLKEYNELVRRVAELDYQLEESKNLVMQYSQKMQTLETENLEYKEFQEEIFDVVSRRKKEHQTTKDY